MVAIMEAMEVVHAALDAEGNAAGVNAGCVQEQLRDPCSVASAAGRVVCAVAGAEATWVARGGSLSQRALKCVVACARYAHAGLSEHALSTLPGLAAVPVRRRLAEKFILS